SNQETLTRDDYVIVAGDFGFLWKPEYKMEKLRRLAELPFTVLFVDGNHENYDLLEEYPVEEWKGGKIHRITDNVIHLMRGQIFNIDGKSILAFGGAESTDKCMRRLGVSLWKQEEITQDDVDEAQSNLDKYDRRVDYVISHSCSSNLKQFYYYVFQRYNVELKFYSEQPMIGIVENYIKEYKQWYFGHFHFDADIDGKHTAVYDEIIPLE
ncbi:MAG: metallophosphatase, partial [Clostridia bacterium]|nr:metallophosphatase [Clostridia bacterium]